MDETSAIPAASEVSLPYPAGTTTVFKPVGIAATQSAHLKNVSLKKELWGKTRKIAIKSNGYKTSFNAVTI